MSAASFGFVAWVDTEEMTTKVNLAYLTAVHEVDVLLAAGAVTAAAASPQVVQPHLEVVLGSAGTDFFPLS